MAAGISGKEHGLRIALMKKSGLTTVSLASLSIAAILASQPVLAQTAPEEDGASTETIIVTGQKLEQSLAQTPNSVVVATGEQLDQPFYSDVTDFLRRVPNVQFDSSGNLPFVRGIDGSGVSAGADGAITGGRPRITTYVDGVPRAFSFVPNGVPVTWDIDQLEFYRGAQSTAIGRNAIAGAIVVQTKDPVDQFEGAAQVAIRSEDTSFSGAATINIPLVADRLALRASVDGFTGDNYIDYVGPLTGRDDFISRDDGYRLRAKLAFRPNGFADDLSFRLAYERQHARRPSPEDVIELATFPALQLSNPSIISAFKLDSEFASFEANVPLSTDWTAYGIVSYQNARERGLPIFDDGSSLDVFANSKELTGELRLSYAPTESRLRAVMGAFAFDRNRDEGGKPGSLFVYSADDQGRTFALFGEAAVPVGPLDILIGGRWERERQDRNFTTALGFDLVFDQRSSIFLPKGGLRYNLAENSNLTALYFKGYSPGASGVSLATFSPYRFARETSDNLEIAYRGEWRDLGLTINANLFASWFNGQQILANGPGGPFDLIVVNAERTRSIGFEADARLRVSDLLSLSGAIGLLDADILRFGSVENEQFDGNKLPFSPSFTARLGFELRPAAGFSLDTDVRYVSAYDPAFQNEPVDRVGNDWLVDVRARYNVGQFSLFAYVENLFDALNPTNRSTSFGSANVSRPRTFGGGVRVNF
jgi:outer membrane receptor protein involved in Fe transport